MKRYGKAQSILEYTIILAAIVGAIVLGANVIGGKVNQGFEDAGQVLEDATGDFANLYSGGSGE